MSLLWSVRIVFNRKGYDRDLTASKSDFADLCGKKKDAFKKIHTKNSTLSSLQYPLK